MSEDETVKVKLGKCADMKQVLRLSEAVRVGFESMHKSLEALLMRIEMLEKRVNGDEYEQ